MTETYFEIEAKSAKDAVEKMIEILIPSWGEITAKKVRNNIYEICIVD